MSERYFDEKDFQIVNTQTYGSTASWDGSYRDATSTEAADIANERIPNLDLVKASAFRLVCKEVEEWREKYIALAQDAHIEISMLKQNIMELQEKLETK